MSKLLVDGLGRTHNYLRISLTEKCNLRCSYCMPAEGIQLRAKSHFMTADEIISIAHTFVELGVDKIRITGGEPLVRKDVDVILRGICKTGVDVGITTNAILLDKNTLVGNKNVRSKVWMPLHFCIWLSKVFP